MSACLFVAWLIRTYASAVSTGVVRAFKTFN